MARKANTGRRSLKRRRDTPLRARVTSGVLTIEIGVDTLAFSAIHSPYTYALAGDRTTREGLEERFKITNARGFALDVKRELFDEAEDGSSLLTKLLDDACVKAIEEGAEHFFDTENDNPEDA